MRRGRVLTVTGVITVAVLSGCGSPAKSGGTRAKVATLTSSAPGASASVAGPQPPRARIDMTQDEQDALMVPYEKCLSSHGVSQLDAKKSQDASHSGGTANKWAAYCEQHYFPLPPWETDPANPEAGDFAVAVVKCLKAKGVPKVDVGDDGITIAFGGDDNDPRSISMGLDLMPGCEREVAAKK